MNVFHMDNTVAVGRLNVDLGRMPVEARLSPARMPQLVGLGFASIWLVVSASIFTAFLSAPVGVQVFAALFPVLGVVLVLYFLYGVLRSRHVRFDDRGVTVYERKWFKEWSWSAPYSEFEGVLLRERTVRANKQPEVVQIIELSHTDPAKRIPLYIEPGNKPPRAIWEALARKLDLPTIRQDLRRGLRKRPVDELDRPIRELAQSDKLPLGYTPEEPVPRGLRVETIEGQSGDQDDAFVVVLLAPRWAWWVWLLAAAPGLGLAGAGLQTEAWPMVAVGVAALAPVLCLIWLDHAYPRALVVTREQMIIRDPWRFGRGRKKSLAMDEIETVRIARAGAGLGAELRIASDRDALETGAGLSQHALDWLARFVISAIATA